VTSAEQDGAGITPMCGNGGITPMCGMCRIPTVLPPVLAKCVKLQNVHLG